MNELWIIGVVGGGAGAAVGGPLLLRSRPEGERWSLERLIGLWLVGAAVAMLLIGVRHGGLLSPGWDHLVEHVTDAASLVAWTTLVAISRRMAGLGPLVPSGVVGHLALPGLYAVVVVATGIPDVPFLWLQPVGAASVMVIAWVWHGARANAPRHAARQVGPVLVLSATLFLAQAIRSLFPAVIEVREIVPLVMALSTFALAFVLARPSIRALSPAVIRPDDGAQRADASRYRKSSLTAAEADQLMGTLNERMNGAGWYREPDLSLAALALRLDVSPQRLSQALNQRCGVTLLQYLTRRRISEARRLLVDPGNDCFTIEGIARQSGFASRSAFYRLFREAEGITPTEYRSRAREGHGSNRGEATSDADACESRPPASTPG
jgi:AraC-like DNA-binding protein